MDCPRCKQPLQALDLGQFAGEYPDVAIDFCPSCHGAWYERGELDRSDESVWTDVESLPFVDVAGIRAGPCPRCGVAMAPVSPARFADVVLDRCPSCAGFWLDAGELRALQAHAARLDSEKSKRMTTLSSPRAGALDGLLLWGVLASGPSRGESESSAGDGE
jgi:Zn-finger nucleic acid-binding protein